MRFIFFIITGVAEASVAFFPPIKQDHPGSGIPEISKTGSILFDEVPEEMDSIDLNFSKERRRRGSLYGALPARKGEDDGVLSGILGAKTVEDVHSLAMSAILDAQLAGDAVKVEKIIRIRDIALRALSEGWQRHPSHSPHIPRDGTRSRVRSSKTNSILEQTRNTLNKVYFENGLDMNGKFKLPSIKTGAGSLSI